MHQKTFAAAMKAAELVQEWQKECLEYSTEELKLRALVDKIEVALNSAYQTGKLDQIDQRYEHPS